MRYTLPACCALAVREAARMPPTTLPMNVRRSITESPGATNGMSRIITSCSSIQSYRVYYGLVRDARINVCLERNATRPDLAGRGPIIEGPSSMDDLDISRPVDGNERVDTPAKPTIVQCPSRAEQSAAHSIRHHRTPAESYRQPWRS